MERLNNRLGRTPQSHRQDTEQRLQYSNGRSSQVQRLGVTSSRPPLREQTAHLGLGSRSAQSHMQNSTAPGIAHVDAADAYSTVIGADVREEWDDDTADMRYGDWENDANEEYTHIQPRQLPPSQYFSQEAHRSVRMTQPLRPQPTLRANQDITQERPHIQKPAPQLARREQEPPYTLVNSCPICKGAGFLRADVPYGHPSFGKPIACECKEAERKAKRRQQLQEMSNLGAFYDKSFANFNYGVPGVQEAFRTAYEFAQNPDGWFLLIGPNGCGKTHLAAAIANQSLEVGALVLFATVPDLLDHLRGAFAPSSTEVYDQLFARMREAEVLVLDDLGAQQSSPWANEKLFQLLNYRYNSRFPTVITANSKGLQGIDERIRSRLTDASLVITVILDRARDYRPQNPRKS